MHYVSVVSYHQRTVAIDHTTSTHDAAGYVHTRYIAGVTDIRNYISVVADDIDVVVHTQAMLDSELCTGFKNLSPRML